MIRNEKKILGPTSCMASMTVCVRVFVLSGTARRLWMFSIMTIAASTIAPIATAIPPSDMMLAVRP